MSSLLATLGIFLTLASTGFPVSIGRGGPVKESGPIFVGSTPADIKDFPYQLSVRYYNTHVCNGVIISPKWALTTASCVEYYTPQSVNVRAGSGNIYSGGSIYQVANIVRHPRYNSTRLDNNIAILNFTRPLVFGRNVSAVVLFSSNENALDNTTGVASGWGQISTSGPSFSANLRKMSLPVVNQRVCNALYKGNYTNNMMCAGFLNSSNNLNSSGAPFVIKNKLAGISSNTRGRNPTVFTRIAAVRAWIKSVTRL